MGSYSSLISRTSRPGEYPLPVGVQDADGDEREEDEHFDERGRAETRGREDGRPREQEDGVDGEDHVEVGEDVVAHLRLGPALADRVDAALVGGELLRGRPIR